MKTDYRVVVIGGGIVGTSVLYQLARLGWSDSALIERAELTVGSSWHAAGGFHALNDDPNIAALQAYTINLYKEIEEESGQSVGMHMPGGYSLATTPARWEWLKAEWALYQTLGIGTRLATPDEIVADCPIVDPAGLLGGLFDPHEGAVDPHGATHAFAGAARKRGADIILRNRVLALTALPDGRWRVDTEHGVVTAEHVVNAAGLWARRVGRMAGIDLPLTPMQHHYLVTEDLPELVARKDEMPCVTDLEGFTYLQQERKGVLLGVYERNPRHWKTEGADWDYGMDLIPEEIDRISDELAIGFRRFPSLAAAGIRRWVNGAFTFTPDGNPLVGPVPGLRNYWTACGCMSGFSQGGAIGLVLARWIVDGDPGADVFGMDVARYGAFASNDTYLRDTTAQFYARRFVLAYPNEELPAGRPLKTAPVYDLQVAAGARFGVVWGTETPQYFAPGRPDFVETPSARRSDADDFVAAEVLATRAAAGLLDAAVYARYEVSGRGAEKWLNRLLANRMPAIGRIRLAPMLSPAGRLMGDLTVSRLDDTRFWLVGSYYLQEWHLRWFRDHLPRSGVRIDNLSESWLGFSLSGPRSRELLARLTREDVADVALPFLSFRRMDVGLTQALVARMSLTGELGYEITVPAMQQRTLWNALVREGADLGLRPIGMRAQDSLRLEKGYGVWSLEFAQSYTPAMSGLERFIAFDKGAFIGRDAALKERDTGPSQRLALLAVDADDADATGFEPVWADGCRVGFVTSGAYGHYVRQSLALAYLDRAIAENPVPLEIHVVGELRQARILAEPPYDPRGLKLRG
ncbi:MAG TPA: FAD-dependent oxidoreductase [Steroidobacteraceae bacterium]|nr:FAD-dependent oxidoreductase [Steroidobacteraceae bacterium]